jgi:hypothetical protein
MNGGGRLLFLSIGDLFWQERIEGALIADVGETCINLGSPRFAHTITAAPDRTAQLTVDFHGKACQLRE